MAPKLTTETKTVTPTMAKRFLEKNHPKNRPIQWGRVEAFVADMQRGAWKLTHQGICFDAEDYLIDGQHRLQAIVKSGVAVEMLVVHNAVGEFEAPIDRGQPRSLTLITGKTRRQIATISLLRQFEQGYQSTTPVTMEDLEQFSARHAEGIQQLEAIRGSSRFMAGTAAALAWALPGDTLKVTAWANAALTGEMLSKGDPALAYRRWLEREKQRRPSPWTAAMATFNCIRSHLTDMKLASVYTGESGFRAITARRRKLGIEHTPSTDLVPGLSLKPSRGERGEDSEEAE